MGTGVFMYLTYSRKKQKEILWRKRVQFKKISHNSDVGRCFGADIGTRLSGFRECGFCCNAFKTYVYNSVGGTLAKLVYFEQTKNTDFMRKPRSLSHSVAANELRSFLIGRDSYGGTGIRDSSLSVEVESLGGVCSDNKKSSLPLFKITNLINLPWNRRCISSDLKHVKWKVL